MRSPTYADLLKDFYQNQQPPLGKLINIVGVENGKTAYNPSLIEQNGQHYLVARVESVTSNWVVPESYDPTAVFFKKNNTGQWEPDQSIQPFQFLEDPFAAWIEDEQEHPLLIFGGVQIDRSGPKPEYYTALYKGRSIQTLERTPFTIISHMKDIRIVQRKSNKQIVVCTRPLVNGDNTGRIGIFSVNSINELNSQTAYTACVSLDQVAEGTWIGNNKLYLLQDPHTGNERIGVLCHVAYLHTDRSRHYSAAVFTFDPDNPCDEDTHQIRPRIIATRSNFENGPTKTELLQDVVFPAGLEHQQDGLIKLYAGLSDAAIGTLVLPDPFL